MHHTSTPLYVRHAQFETLKRGGLSVHVDYVLWFLQRGWLDFDAGERVRIKAGSVILVPAGVPHRSYGGSDLAVWIVGFCGSCQGLDESMPVMEPFSRVRQGGLPMVEIPQARRAWIEHLCQELQHARPGAIDPVVPLLSLLLHEVATVEILSPAVRADDSLVSQALLFIQRNAFESISLRDVAQAVHRSQAHVATTVRTETGHTVGDWINAQRAAEAVRWLSHTDASISEVARRVGWKDTTHFIRMFKRAHGITPAAWRRENRHGEKASETVVLRATKENKR